MNTLLTILAVVALLALLAGLFYILFRIQLAMCEDCPLKDKCLHDKQDVANSGLPPCMTRFNLPDNNFFN